MFTGPIYFGSFFLLWAHLMANTRIDVHSSHLLSYFFFIVCTPYGKYSRQCSQVPSTFAVFLCCVHTLWQISTSMFTGPIYFGSFSLLCAYLIANIHIHVYRSHLLWLFFFAVGTPYGKYAHQCSQVPSTFALFLYCAHTLWQISTSMFTGPIYFCGFCLLCAHLMQISTSMLTGPIYFCSFSVLCAYLKANIHIHAYRSHLLLQFFFAACTPYSKYVHRCLQVCGHALQQIFTSMFTSPIYFDSFSLLCAHLITNIHINAYKPHLLCNFSLLCRHPMVNILINVQPHLLLQLFFVVGAP